MPAEEGAAKPIGDDWSEANKATRAAATWVVVSLGALAAAIYGATPIVKAFDLSWADAHQAVQLRAAALFGFFGLLAMIALVLIVGRTMVPIISSQSLLASTREVVKTDPHSWLPNEMATVDELELAIARARAVWQESNVRLREYQSVRNDSGIGREKALMTKTAARLEMLQSRMSEIARLDGFQRIRRSFFNATVITLTIVAAIGSLGFSLALPSGKDDADETASDAPVTPQLGYLTPGFDAGAAMLLYQSLGIEGCVVGSAPGVVAVIVLETTGDKSTVETVPSATCVSRQFTVISDVVSIEFSIDPQPVEVTYTAAPTTSPTP